MDVARTAVRGAAGSYPGGGGAGVAAVMKLAPNVDVEALQVRRALPRARTGDAFS
jgi:hypothetical protein